MVGMGRPLVHNHTIELAATEAMVAAMREQATSTTNLINQVLRGSSGCSSNTHD